MGCLVVIPVFLSQGKVAGDADSPASSDQSVPISNLEQSAKTGDASSIETEMPMIEIGATEYLIASMKTDGRRIKCSHWNRFAMAGIAMTRKSSRLPLARSRLVSPCRRSPIYRSKNRCRLASSCRCVHVPVGRCQLTCLLARTDVCAALGETRYLQRFRGRGTALCERPRI